MELQHIVEHIHQGDRDAYGQLYTACRGRLRSLCMYYVHDEMQADDLLHDAFVLIFSKIGELKNAARAEAWMTTVTRNVCLYYLRQQRQHAEVPIDEVAGADTLAVTLPSPVTFDEIMRLVDALPEGYARVFRLSVLEGLDHQQIGTLLGIGPHTSSSQLYRAKQALRRMLRPLVLVLLAALLPLALYLGRKHTAIEQPLPSDAPLGKDVSHAPQSTSPKPLVPPKPVVSSMPVAKTPIAVVLCDSVQGAAACETADTLGNEWQIPTLDVADAADAGEQRDTVGHTWQAPVPNDDAVETRGSSRWALALAYSSMSRNFDQQLPYANEETNAAAFDSLAHHSMPLTLSLSVGYRLSEHWQLATGVQYTQLQSEMLSGNSYGSLHQEQTVRYVGVPLSLSWRQSVGRRLQVYGAASVALHLPLRSTRESVYRLGGLQVDPTTERLHPGVQWSVGIGLGVQYQLWPHLSTFAEPGVQHYFDNGSGIATWNTAHHIVFSLPLGVRLTW